MDEDEMLPEEDNEEEDIVDEPTYESLALEEPEREVSLENLEVPKDEADMEDGDLIAKTDFQSALVEITPHFKDKRMESVLNPILKSRVFPDNYLDLNYLLAMGFIEESEDEDDIDFLSIITGSQVATSVAYEGKHIIDVSELFGAANEQEMEKLSKEILGG